MLVKISVCNRRTDKKYKNKELEWAYITDRNRNPIRTSETAEEYPKLSKAQRGELKDIGGLVGGWLKDGIRKNGNVTFRTLGLLDADIVPADADFQNIVRTALDGVTYFLYSTHSHTPETPRFRIVILFDREVSEDEYPAAMRMVAKQIGMKSTDHLKMPELVSSEYSVQLSDDEKKRYDELKQDLVLQFPDGDITAANAAALTGKLCQMANGAIYTDDGSTITIHDRKLDALEDIIEAAGDKPLLVAYWFKHEASKTQEQLYSDIKQNVLWQCFEDFPFDDDTEIFVNPSGRFVEGGPAADTGLTGRKMMVDTFGGLALHGGGAFSGKDPTKVDRSGAYMARYIAKNIVWSGLADKCGVALSYAIGKADPVAVDIDTFGTCALSNEALREIVMSEFNLRPAAIIEKLVLRNAIYEDTATYGHFNSCLFPWEDTSMGRKAIRAYRLARTNYP